MDERFIDLESRLAFQEHSLQEMSDVVAAQQQRIELLQQQVLTLQQQLKAVAPSLVASEAEEAPPPHY